MTSRFFQASCTFVWFYKTLWKSHSEICMRGTELTPMSELKSVFLPGITMDLQRGDHSLEGSARSTHRQLRQEIPFFSSGLFLFPRAVPPPWAEDRGYRAEGGDGREVRDLSLSHQGSRRGWECPAPQENSVGQGADPSPLQGMGITPCSGGEMQNSSALEVSSTALCTPTLPKLCHCPSTVPPARKSTKSAETLGAGKSHRTVFLKKNPLFIVMKCW